MIGRINIKYKIVSKHTYWMIPRRDPRIEKIVIPCEKGGCVLVDVALGRELHPLLFLALVAEPNLTFKFYTNLFLTD